MFGNGDFDGGFRVAARQATIQAAIRTVMVLGVVGLLIWGALQIAEHLGLDSGAPRARTSTSAGK